MISKLSLKNQLFLLILLSTSMLYFNTINIQALNLDDCQISAVTDMHVLQTTLINVTVNGTEGLVQGATVNISAPFGSFVDNGGQWIELITDVSGEVSVAWRAPDTDNETSSIVVTISANITSGSDQLIINHGITIHPIDFSLSTVMATFDEVYEFHNSSIVVEAKGVYGTINGANVTIESLERGGFPSVNGDPTISVNTADEGKAVVVWQAPAIISEEPAFDVNITATITFLGKIVSSFLSQNITVHPIDFDTSTLEFSESEVSGGSAVAVTVTTSGTIGPVSGALIELDALGGVFVNDETTIIGYSDISGLYVETWTAPEVTEIINITIIATINYPDVVVVKIIEDDIVVSPLVHEFASIELEANITTVTVGELVEITLTILNELSNPTEGANATFVAPDGTFVGSGTDTIELTSSALGIVVVVWDTSDLEPTIGGLDYQIEVSLIKESYNSNSSSISIHVNPIILKLSTDSNANPSSITQGDNVTIIVFVSANEQAIEGVSVQITAQDGVFESSISVIATINTNSTGYVKFIWITADMTVTQVKQYSFNIQANFPGYDISEIEILEVLVNPVEVETTETTSTNGDEPDSNALGIILGTAGGILILGAVGYYFLKRKYST